MGVKITLAYIGSLWEHCLCRKDVATRCFGARHQLIVLEAKLMLEVGTRARVSKSEKLWLVDFVFLKRTKEDFNPAAVCSLIF